MELRHERGTYFKEHSHPDVRGKVVLETTDDLHGEPGYRLAEKDTDTGKWFDYWQPARHLHDEENLGASEKKGELDEEKIEAIVGNLGVDSSEPLEEVTRVKDVMEPAAVEAIIGSNEE